MAEIEEPQLYPTSCPLCGRFIAELPEGAEAFCCGIWHKAKSLEQKQTEIEAQKKKWFKSLGKKKRKKR